jgi:hypothetical protein
VAAGRMALEVTLTLAPGAPPWVPGDVQLTEASHPEPLPVRGMRLLGGTALQPGNTTRLLVEWDTPQEAEHLVYTVRVSEQNGARRVEVGLRRLSDSSPAAPAVAPVQEKKP